MKRPVGANGRGRLGNSNRGELTNAAKPFLSPRPKGHVTSCNMQTRNVQHGCPESDDFMLVGWWPTSLETQPRTLPVPLHPLWGLRLFTHRQRYQPPHGTAGHRNGTRFPPHPRHVRLPSALQGNVGLIDPSSNSSRHWAMALPEYTEVAHGRRCQDLDHHQLVMAPPLRATPNREWTCRVADRINDRKRCEEGDKCSVCAAPGGLFFRPTLLETISMIAHFEVDWTR